MIAPGTARAGRRGGRAVLGGLALVAAAACGSPPPDLVLISLDTVRADHLSLYGYERQTTPRLDRFAAQGCRIFERSLSSSTWTLPSHASLFTGLLPREHGLTGVARRLPRSIPTVAERLRGAGYETAAVTDGGFLAPGWGLERGFAVYRTSPGEAWDPKDARPLFARAAAELDRLRSLEAPFFLFVHSYEAHQPYENRDGFADPFLDPGYRGAFDQRADSSSRWAAAPAAGDLRRMVDLYDGEVRRLDHHLGDFLARLTDGGRRAWVVITSDHGEAFGESGTFEHGLGRVEDENVLVPLLVCGPDRRPSRRSAVRTSSLDVAPTLLGLAGAEPLPHGLGRSLVGMGPDDRRWAVAHGFNSHPELDEEWLRVEDDASFLTVDLRRRAVVGRGDERAARARALVVLGRGSGARRLVLLPRGLDRLELAGLGNATPLGLIDDAGWQLRATPGARRLDLDPASRSLLLLRGSLDAPLAFRIDGGRLRPGRDGAEEGGEPRPFEGVAELELRALAGGHRPRAENARPDVGREAELKALGYL